MPIILSYARTPFSAAFGRLAQHSAAQLGAAAIAGAAARGRIEPSEIDMCIFGHVLTAGCGPQPAAEAARIAGATRASALSVSQGAASSLAAVGFSGLRGVTAAVGMESVSRTPHIFRRSAMNLISDLSLEDSVKADAVDKQMALHAENLEISRIDQDAYALESYRRAAAGWSSGFFAKEVEAIAGVDKDDLFTQMTLTTLPSYKPIFVKDTGSITAANSAKLADGAACVIIAADDFVKKHKLEGLARIRASLDLPGQADDAVRAALRCAVVPIQAVDFWEIQEDFACNVIDLSRKLKLDASRVNMHGGAISLGNPLGASGARLVGSLSRILNSRSARFGCAVARHSAGTSVVVLEKM